MDLSALYQQVGNVPRQIGQDIQQNQLMQANLASQAGQDQRAQQTFDQNQLRDQQFQNALVGALGPQQAGLALQADPSLGQPQDQAPPQNAFLQQMFAADPQRAAQFMQFQQQQQQAAQKQQQEQAAMIVRQAQYVLASDAPLHLIKQIAPEYLAELEKQHGIDPEKLTNDDAHMLAQETIAHFGPIAGIGPVEQGATEVQSAQMLDNGNIGYLTKDGRIVDTGRKAAAPTSKIATSTESDAGGGFDDPKVQALQAAIAASGYSLPTGFRAQASQLSLLKGILAKYPDLEPDDIAHLLGSGAIDYKGLTKATQTAAGIAGKAEFANKELEAFAPIALDASAAVDRGSFVPFNKLKQLGQKNISDPDMKRLYVATQTILTAYNMLSARGGTDADVRAHNRQVLQAADSPEAYQAAVEMIMKEGKAAGSAASKAMNPESYREKPAAGGGAPAAAIEYLRTNPSMKGAFKAKYGYLPEGV